MLSGIGGKIKSNKKLIRNSHEQFPHEPDLYKKDYYYYNILLTSPWGLC